MTATNHALAGALIAIAIPKPLVAIPLAFAAHFAMDAIPHFGLKEKDVFLRNKQRTFWIVLAVDMVIAAALLLAIPILITGVPAWLTFTCMFACMSPDLIWGWRLFQEVQWRKVKPRNLLSRFHKTIQWSETPKGAIVEIAWFISAVGLIFWRYI